MTNTGKLVKTYKLTHVPAGTANTVREVSGRIYFGSRIFDILSSQHSIYPNLGPVSLFTRYATVEFTKTTFTLKPGSSIEISVTIKPPAGIDHTMFPVFSGFVQVDSGDESLHVTYLGLAASLKDKQIVDNTAAFFGFKLPALLNKSGQAQLGPANYSFVSGDVPKVLLR